MCDQHPDRLAVVRLQGETDSFGAELNDMCTECRDAYREYLRTADTSGVCDWCKAHKPKLRPRRDIDEGSHGRVYDVCDDCIDKENQRLAEELAEYERVRRM